MFDIENLSPKERQEIIDTIPIYKKIKKLESLSFEMGIYEYDDRISYSKHNKLLKQLQDLKNEIINELVILYFLDA